MMKWQVSGDNHTEEFVGPLPVKYDVKKLAFDWFDNILSVGREFDPEEVAVYIRIFTAGVRKPRSATITRYIRMYREEGGYIRNTSRSKGLYIKDKDR